MSKKDDFIFLNAMEFPTIGKTGKINWKESVGRFIKFERVENKQSYQLKIEEYINNRKILVLFEDRKEYLQLKNLSPNNFNLNTLFSHRKKPNFEDPKESSIISLEDCQPQYITSKVEYINGHQAKKYVLHCPKYGCFVTIGKENASEKHKCNACRNKETIFGFNSLYDTHLEIAGMLLDKELAKQYSAGSSKEVTFICPNCKRKIDGKSIGYVVKHGLNCECESSSTSLEIWFEFLLVELGIKYEPQMSFEWARSKTGRDRMHDFYLPKHKMIIEIYGPHHFFEVEHYQRTLEEVQIDDKEREELALKNNVGYIHVDFPNQCVSSGQFKNAFLRNESIMTFINENYGINMHGADEVFEKCFINMKIKMMQKKYNYNDIRYL